MNAYQQLASTLAASGIKCQFQSPAQLIVSTQTGPVLPHRGNSFWFTRADNDWHLFTWSPIGYRIPEAVDVTALCHACLAHGTIAMYEAPSNIIEQFGLAKLTDDEADLILNKMDERS
jgi:hypothetical protein